MHFVRWDDLIRILEIPLKVDILDGQACDRQSQQSNNLLEHISKPTKAR
jgi:hypothetical protein